MSIRVGAIMTKVLCSAVIKDGEIWCGKRHAELIALAHKKTGKRIYSKDQGFLVTGQRFVSREEAKEIAKKAGQISEDFSGILTSEDLW
jgi:hypothetical protein